jgi:hypothetical protein
VAYLSEVVPVIPYWAFDATTYNDSVSIGKDAAHKEEIQ